MSAPFRYLTPRSIDVAAVGDMAGPTADGQAQCPVPPGSPRLPNRPRAGASAPPTRIIFPPWLAKLGSNSFDFYAADFEMALPAAVGGTVTSALLQFQLPQGTVGYLQNASLYVLTPLATVKARWDLRINGGPIQGFSTLRNPPVTANVMYRQFSDMAQRIPMGATVDVLITNLSGVAATVGGEIGGWYHSAAAEATAWGPDV